VFYVDGGQHMDCVENINSLLNGWRRKECTRKQSTEGFYSPRHMSGSCEDNLNARLGWVAVYY
jgi:hypothetical protein